jgi:hypothetical protein
MIIKLVKAIESCDYDTVRYIFKDDIQNYVTNKEGGADLVVGAENYIKALQHMNFLKVRPTLTITQIDVISEAQAMFMIEVKAAKPDRALHNFAAFLIDIDQDKIAKMRMVEALPEYSDKFWNEY